jgi:NDP-sugar pyrophosphorylase family protein
MLTRGVNPAQVINSVLMANVRIADGAHVQASILCDGVRVAEHAILRDCQVRSLRSTPELDFPSQHFWAGETQRRLATPGAGARAGCRVAAAREQVLAPGDR